MDPKILIIDGMNFMHRCRAGFQAPHSIVYNAFRNLRALIEVHAPTRVIFVLEGTPVKRLAISSDYKGTRAVEPGSIKELEMAPFYAQCEVTIDTMKRHFPISVVQHPGFECDDTIYNLIKRSSTAVPWIVASNDTDFIQLLNEFDHVSLYNMMTKEFVDKPAYDYVTWKSLRGDGSDNIKGLPGIGDVTATKLIDDPEALKKLFESNELANQFAKNYSMIKFHTWSNDEAELMNSSSPIRDWNAVEASFAGWGFKSIVKEPYWTRFKVTFDPLFG